MELIKTLKSNLIFVIIATLLLLGIGFLVGRASSNNQEEVDVLEMRYADLEKSANDKDRFIGMLNDELFEINTNLNSISFDSIALAGLDDPQTKINFLDSLLEESSQRILKLESMVANDKSGESAKLLQTIISDLEHKLLEKETLISQLSIENEKLVDDNNILYRKVSKLTNSENELLADIDAQMKDLQRLKNDLEKAENSLVEVEKDLKKSYSAAQKEIAESSFVKGQEKLKEFDQLKAKRFKVQKKLKAELVNEAFENFVLACENGHPEAYKFIQNLMKIKKYSKHLKIDSYGDGLSSCIIG